MTKKEKFEKYLAASSNYNWEPNSPVMDSFTIEKIATDEVVPEEFFDEYFSVFTSYIDKLLRNNMFSEDFLKRHSDVFLTEAHYSTLLMDQEYSEDFLKYAMEKMPDRKDMIVYYASRNYNIRLSGKFIDRYADIIDWETMLKHRYMYSKKFDITLIEKHKDRLKHILSDYIKGIDIPEDKIEYYLDKYKIDFESFISTRILKEETLLNLVKNFKNGKKEKERKITLVLLYQFENLSQKAIESMLDMLSIHDFSKYPYILSIFENTAFALRITDKAGFIRKYADRILPSSEDDILSLSEKILSSILKYWNLDSDTLNFLFNKADKKMKKIFLTCPTEEIISYLKKEYPNQELIQTLRVSVYNIGNLSLDTVKKTFPWLIDSFNTVYYSKYTEELADALYEKWEKDSPDTLQAHLFGFIESNENTSSEIKKRLIIKNPEAFIDSVPENVSYFSYYMEIANKLPELMDFKTMEADTLLKTLRKMHDYGLVPETEGIRKITKDIMENFNNKSFNKDKIIALKILDVLELLKKMNGNKVFGLKSKDKALGGKIEV